MKVYKTVSTRATAQDEAILGRENEQTRNAAGGYVFKLDPWKLFERFLIQGSEGGTFYVKEKALTRENAANMLACIAADGPRAVKAVVDVSTRGLAPKNDPALFALAAASGAESADTRKLALAALPQVARIPTHLFHFVAYAKQFRGLGRGLKRAIADWYQTKPVADLAYQVVKYQQRDGYSNRDCLRLSHPKTSDPDRNALYKWITDGIGSFGESNADHLPRIVRAFEFVKDQPSTGEIVSSIESYDLSREMVPTESLKSPEVWEALLAKMPPTALIRNLGTMSKVGLLTPLSEASKIVELKLMDQGAFRRGRVHPIAILIAMKQYALGHGLKGDGEWKPVPAVLDALDSAFYDSFEYLEPCGKNLLIAVDMSGSMMGSSWRGYAGNYLKDIAGTCLHPCEAAAAMALACVKKEQSFYVMGFADKFRDLGITPRMRLDEAVKLCLANTFGRTDCALPMVHARAEKMRVDGFVVLTDNETWVGNIQPSQALRAYRESSGIDAKEVVIAMVPQPFSIADPKDLGMLDVAGFSPDIPAVVSSFVRG